MDERLRRAAEVICERRKVAVLTGAGISVESGIPDFRSPDGLWARFDPSEYATLRAFRRDPHKVWRMLSELVEVMEAARPNRAHQVLAEWEQGSLVEGVITQNIDGLHQAAGSRRVLEFHGGCETLTCLQCDRRYTRHEAKGMGNPPCCPCGYLLKPDVILFGEMIPEAVLGSSHGLAENCSVLLVVGTSAEVAPANQIPWLAKKAGAVVIEVNREPSALTGPVADIYLEGSASRVLQQLHAMVWPNRERR